jgi:hypothetical protein
MLISLVTEVAEVTFVHTVVLKASASFSAETQEKLEKAIGTGVKISAEGGQDKRVCRKGRQGLRKL